MQHTNELGQPISYPITDFQPPFHPDFTALSGHVVTVSPIMLEHLSSLNSAFDLDVDGCNWTYLPYGPFANESEFTTWAMSTCFTEDPKFYTISNDEGPAGIASYLRVDPKIGCIEIGHIHLSPMLQRTRAGTEALLLMIRWAFEAGYRRLEWKCDALNIPSRCAAKRLGFSFEGTFRQATIYKSRNRDTTWYAITSKDWPNLNVAYQTWSNPRNFDAEGREIQKLSILTAQAIVSRGLS